jgi:hypothetical protein
MTFIYYELNFSNVALSGHSPYSPFH